MIERIDGYIHAPIAAVRPYLLARAILALLAFDCFLELYSRGGRYGIGGFNVAHFALLDALLPVPTAGTYIAVILTAGVLAAAAAISGPRPVLLVPLTVLYTYGWAMSMLDSYQHHYLITLMLLGMIFFPRLTSKDLIAPKRQLVVVHSYGYVLVCLVCALVYLWTAYAKSEPEWRAGTALELIATAADHSESNDEAESDSEGRASLVALQQALEDKGISHDRFWLLLGHGAILVQLLIAAGFLCAPLYERDPKNMRVATGVALLAAFSFHWGAERLNLRIGWFSYYMFIVAFCVFFPSRWLQGLAVVATTPARALADKLAGDERGTALPIAIGGGLVVALAATQLGLPGATAAGLLLGAFTIGLAIYGHTKKREDETRGMTIGLVIGGLVMWLAISTSDSRFDFYRRIAGEASRRGEYQMALDAYIDAEKHAPEGKSRAKQIDRMRALLRQERR